MKALKNSSIRLDMNHHLIHIKWLRSVNSKEFRASVIQFSKALRNNRATCCLLDITRLTSPDMHDQKWTARLIGNSLCDKPLKKIAVILPNDLFLEVVTEKMAEEVLRICDGQVQIACFRENPQALSWLQIAGDQQEKVSV